MNIKFTSILLVSAVALSACSGTFKASTSCDINGKSGYTFGNGECFKISKGNGGSNEDTDSGNADSGGQGNSGGGGGSGDSGGQGNSGGGNSGGPGNGNGNAGNSGNGGGNTNGSGPGTGNNGSGHK